MHFCSVTALSFGSVCLSLAAHTRKIMRCSYLPNEPQRGWEYISIPFIWTKHCICDTLRVLRSCSVLPIKWIPDANPGAVALQKSHILWIPINTGHYTHDIINIDIINTEHYTDIIGTTL